MIGAPQANKGFTLVELLVAIGLFSVIVSIAIGGFVNALKTQREVAALIATQSNAGLAFEQITREIRTGYLFNIGGGGSSPDQSSTCDVADLVNASGTSGGPGAEVWTCSNLDFINAEGDEVNYALGDAPDGTAGELMRNDAPVTGNNVIVQSLSFQIFGNIEGDHWPPRITISMSVAPSSTDPAVKNDIINLQTTVSAREMDCSSDGSVGC